MAKGYGNELFTDLEPCQTAQQILADLTELEVESNALGDVGDSYTELGFDSGSGGVKAAQILDQDTIYSPFAGGSDDDDFFGENGDYGDVF